MQERTQLEIEGELLRKEEDVCVDFDAAFRQRPQVLVEMVSGLRRYGDLEVLRNLVFAAETLYGEKLLELPGGIEFWEDLKKEVAPLPHPQALTPSDLRIQRLQAIEIFREAIVSYDMLADTAPIPPAPRPSEPEPAHVETALDPPAGATGPPVLQPAPAVEAAALPSPTETAAEPPAAPSATPPSDEQARRPDLMAHRIMQQEEALKKDFDTLVARERKLEAFEKRLEEKEQALLACENEAGKRQAGHAEELERLRRREAELAGELAKTRELHQKTAGELERATRQAADGAASAGALLERERALALERQRLDEEISALEKRREGQKAGEEELRADLNDRQERLAVEERGLKERLASAESELAAKRAEIAGREAALAGTERTLQEQEKSLEEERRRLEEDRAARQMPEAPAPTSPQAPAAPAPEALPEAPAEMPSPPVAAQQASISEGNILSRLASLAAQPPEDRPAKETPATMPDIPAPEGEMPEPRVLYKVKCPGCKNIIPVFTRERPLKIKCDACGKEGVLK